ncbi:VOC family protein [Hymenobacter sp. BT491]|uniref:VOC family protein n=1 Tax=Hymenobacter sp. BT491 TaxID=2766779 RepID=UPI00165386D1|nr:VOC family protein [Hymenobacter sp. BT491]MBC6991032.1 VOC family protein [Hymenobacter sp. BT491]
MKTLQLIPYLTFNGNCREAMTFYRDCLGGDLQIQSFADTPAVADQMPAEAQQGVMHAILKSGDLVLMASDSGMGQVTNGNSVSLSLDCPSAEEIATLFAKLSEGGTVTMALADTFWGATFGMFTDRYGMSWMLNYDKEPATQSAENQAVAAH